jgi:hypothetical protein
MAGEPLALDAVDRLAEYLGLELKKKKTRTSAATEEERAV